MAIEEKQDQEKILENYVKQQEIPASEPPKSQIGPNIIEIPGAKKPWEREQYSVGNEIGWIPIPIQDLPTKGFFYPVDTKISIRAASGGEIRHWSTLRDDPTTNPNYLSDMDDMLNYVIERCVTIKSSTSEHALRLSWKDIKEIDRFYLILAIHELTFVNAENKLQVKVSDTKKVDVKKEMVDYISLDPKLMRFYDENERCFVLKIKGGQTFKLDVPCVGVTQWLKKYVLRKRNSQEPIDEDYIEFAPFIIRDWRGLTDDVYNKYCEESHKWNVLAVSLLVEFKKLFADTINPVVKFIDEGGVEQTAPLNFQGGFKSIFIIPDPFRQLE